MLQTGGTTQRIIIPHGTPDLDCTNYFCITSLFVNTIKAVGRKKKALKQMTQCDFNFLNISRTCLMMTPLWTLMVTQLMGSWWRAICTRGPATPSRPGAGTTLLCAFPLMNLTVINPMSTVRLLARQWMKTAKRLNSFSTSGAGFQFRRISWCIRRNSR